MNLPTLTMFAFALVPATLFLGAGAVISIRRGRPDPLLLACLSALSFSWIEAPYDWAMYAQFPPELPRMPGWWPMNMTWGGLPNLVPLGYVSYFVLPALISLAVARWLKGRTTWRPSIVLLTVGLVVGTAWAFLYNGMFGAKTGMFYYGYVIPGLSIREGTKHQYPLYDSLAMGVQMMAMTYLLGRTDKLGRTLVDIWADKLTKSRVKSALLSIAAVVVLGNLFYLSVFAPHLATKMMGLVNVGPTEQLYEGVPNQPL